MPASGQPVRPRNLQLAVLHARSQQDHVARNFAPIGQLDKPVLPIDPQAGGPLGQEFRAESRRLDVRAPSQVRAGDARKEIQDNSQSARWSPPVRRAHRAR